MGDNNNNKKDRYDYVIPTSEGWKPLAETVKQVKDDLLNKKTKDSTGTTDKEIKTGGTQAFTERGLWISGKAKVIEDELEKIGKETSEGINKTIATGLGELTARGEELINRKKLFKASRVVNKSGAMVIRRERRVKDDRSLVAIDKTYPIQRDSFSARDFMFVQYIIDKWQNSPLDSEGYLVIDNLSEVARDLSGTKHKTTPARVKEQIKKMDDMYDVIIGIEKEGNKNRIVTDKKQYFKVRVERLVDDGVEVKLGAIPLRDREILDKYPFDRVRIKPRRFIRYSIGKDRYGGELPPEVKKRVEGLGNIFLSKESIKLLLDLSDLASKIFLYQSVNTPYGVISYDKFIEYLGYTEQDIKDKGNKGIKRDIAKALDELHNVKHLEYWRFKNGNYYWKYTSVWVKHKELIGEKVKDGGYTKGKTVQTPSKDVGEVIDQSKGERREDKVITDEDITKVKTQLIKVYPKALADIEDREMLKTVMGMFIKDNYNSDDYWMDDSWKENYKNFMMGYLNSTDEEYLVRSLDKLRRKILTWKAYKGNWDRFKNDR
jgi:hypothetical protein